MKNEVLKQIKHHMDQINLLLEANLTKTTQETIGECATPKQIAKLKEWNYPISPTLTKKQAWKIIQERIGK